MRAFLAFTKKEFCEVSRTYKLFIMGAVFLIMGMMNPLTAKLTPELLKTFMPEGMNITVPDPSAIDSWMQFFKNVPQMGLIVLMIVFSGTITNEFARGTLITMLTKGLSRSTVILSKFTLTALVWTASYVICFVVSLGYTIYFWNNEGISNLILAVFCLWLFGILLLAVLLLGGVLFNSSYGGLLFAGLFVITLFIIDIIPKIKNYNPIRLASDNVALLTNKIVVSEVTIPIVITIILMILMISCTIVVFNKKQV